MCAHRFFEKVLMQHRENMSSWLLSLTSIPTLAIWWVHHAFNIDLISACSTTNLYNWILNTCAITGTRSQGSLFNNMKGHFPSKYVESKVDMPNLVTGLNMTSRFEWYVIRCGTKNEYQKDVFWIDRTTCSKYDNHSTFKGQHNWGNLYEHLMSTRIFILIWAMKMTRKAVVISIWIC